MNIFANNGDSIRITIWKHQDGDGEFRPLQTYEPIEKFDISIDGESIAVYYNRSKSCVDYYYLNFNNLWYWTRDGKIRNYRRYTT